MEIVWLVEWNYVVSIYVKGLVPHHDVWFSWMITSHICVININNFYNPTFFDKLLSWNIFLTVIFNQWTKPHILSPMFSLIPMRTLIPLNDHWNPIILLTYSLRILANNNSHPKTLILFVSNFKILITSMTRWLVLLPN